MVFARCAATGAKCKEKAGFGILYAGKGKAYRQESIGRESEEGRALDIGRRCNKKSGQMPAF